jgi:hypothetical protein
MKRYITILNCTMMDDSIPVRFNINRVDSIIENNTQEWELGVENFSVPTFKTIPILLTKNTTNVTAGSFIIGERYEIKNVGTTDFTLIGASENEVGVFFTATGTGSGTGIARPQSVYYVYINNLATQVSFPENVNLYSYAGDDVEVYSYESIVLAVNTAIAAACSFFDLTEYPFIRSDGSGNFDFYFPPLFTSNFQDPRNVILPAFTIRFNYELERLFNCFEYETEGGIIEASIRQGENLVTWDGVDYAVRKSQWDPRPAMIRWTRILFLTDTIPIKDELLGSENQKMQSQILDYIINNRILDTTNINYFPQYVKWNNLINSSDLRRMTVRAVLEYEDGTLYPLKIAPDTNFFMKIVFRRKNNGLMIK